MEVHRLPWICVRSFASILQSYFDYVFSHYGQATVVFDGYEGNSTKDMTHARRKNGRKGVSVSFSASMNLTITKEAFLSDTSNKQRFVTLLGEQLEGNGCQVYFPPYRFPQPFVIRGIVVAWSAALNSGARC